MSTELTLDDINEAVEAKYGALIIPVGSHEVELVNALRLPKAKRKALLSLQESMSSTDDEGNEQEVDQEAVLEDMLRLVCKTEGQGNKLITALGSDLAKLVYVFEQYTGKTELGEASPSQD